MPDKTEEKLREIIDEIWKDMRTVRDYAGTAYCTEEESNAMFFKGQYEALKRTVSAIEKHIYILMAEREKGE